MSRTLVPNLHTKIFNLTGNNFIFFPAHKHRTNFFIETGGDVFLWVGRDLEPDVSKWWHIQTHLEDDLFSDGVYGPLFMFSASSTQIKIVSPLVENPLIIEGPPTEPVPPTIDVQPSDLTVTEPDGGVFEVQASHPQGADLFYFWRTNEPRESGNWIHAGNVLSDVVGGINDPILTLGSTEIGQDDDREIRCRIRAYDPDDPTYEVETNSAHLTVEAAVTGKALVVGESGSAAGFSFGDFGDILNNEWIGDGNYIDVLRATDIGGVLWNSRFWADTFTSWNDWDNIIINFNDGEFRWPMTFDGDFYFNDGNDSGFYDYLTANVGNTLPFVIVTEYFHDFRTDGIGAWTHTRGSIATAPDVSGIIQTYTGDEPAFYRDQGLQLEAASTNYIRWSSDLTQSQWIERGPTIISSTEPSPDGGNTGTHIALFDQATQDIRQNGVSSLAPDAPYSPSFWVRSRDNNNFRIINPQSAGLGWWNIDGSQLSGQWERITRDHTAVTVINEFVANPSGGHGIWFQEEFGVTETNIDVWGCQVEDATFSSSHVPTEAANELRNDTECQATFEELKLPAEIDGGFSGQLVFVNPHGPSGLPTTSALLELRADNNNNLRIYHRGDTFTQIRVDLRWGDTDRGTIDLSTSGFPPEEIYDVRWVIRPNEEMKAWLNGTPLNEPITFGAGLPLTVAQMHSNQVNYPIADSRVSQIRIVPYAASDAEIEGWD